MIEKEKAVQRGRYQRIRDAVTDQERKSAQITERVMAYIIEKKAKTVFLYVSFRSEPNTQALFQKLIAHNIQIAVPLCDAKTHTMAAVAVSSRESLVVGHYGILEPDGQKVKDGRLSVLSKDAIDLIVVPALAFDSRGYRLGYGGGYYDRYLKDFSGVTAGLAFSDCMTESLPHGAYDQTVDCVITETETRITK